MSCNFCISLQIDFRQKLLVAHGVVCGMEYLHSVQPHPVVHGDLKIQNVLVGDDLVAKVCLRLFIVFTLCEFCLHIFVTPFIKNVCCHNHPSKL